MTGRPYSIRTRILIGAVTLLSLITGVIALLAYGFATRAADEAFDRVLGAAALSIADAVQIEEGAVTVDVPYAALAILGTSGPNRVFYRVAGPNGAFLTGYFDLGFDRPRARTPEPDFVTADYRGSPIRLATAGRYVSTLGLEGFATIQVAETLEARQALTLQLFRNAMAANLALSALALLLVWAGLHWAFAPFRALEAELRDRAPTDLTPIRTPLPREIGPLLAALDGFMGRLAGLLDRVRGLAADAAHQIRTPLASLRAQAELALSEAEPQAVQRRLRRVHANAVAATQVVNQLLTEATLAHRSQTQGPAPVDLLELVDEVRERLDEAAVTRLSIDTARLGSDGEPLVQADAFALREMLLNLVDNALKYSDGPVTVALFRAERDVGLAVMDEGPGIPALEIGTVVERFKRGAGALGTAGSGLGLSIAKSAVEASGGRLTLANRPEGGLTVTAAWPVVGARRTSAASASLVAAAAFGCLVALFGPGSRADARSETWPAPGGAAATLRVAADGEVPTLRRLIRAFQAKNTSVTVELTEQNSGLLSQAVVTAAAAGAGPDLVVSAAVDRQVKLVNDGFARSHRSGETERLPPWARWREELFAATFEPVVTIYDPRAFTDDEPPRTRLRFAQLLETQPERFRRRVITYHVGLNGMGYVFATFDSLIAPVFWRLTKAMGDAEVQVAAETFEILGALQRGEASIAYNVAASADVTEAARERGLALIEPQDYRLAVLRTLLIPRTALEPELAAAFVNFVLSDEGQGLIGPTALRRMAAARTEPGPSGTVHIIPLSPASLIFLDERKRNRFFDTWIQLMLKP
ncbi:MAG TPA: extracellular solute-binding protein [Beijerinckiaceae bacterium]|jgi:two-component system sensor histidine kinase TctE